MTLCWHDPDPAAVLGIDDGAEPVAAVAAVLRRPGAPPAGTVGHHRLLAVAPGARRHGLGAQLLAASERWLRQQGAGELRAGGEAPFYLWPGVDVAWTAALCLFERAGYAPTGAALNLWCDAAAGSGAARRPAPGGFSVRAVTGPTERTAVLALVSRVWPWWVAETERAIDGGRCLGAFASDGQAGGFGCYSVNRGGWLGPIGTDPDRQQSGVGSAVLAELCRLIGAAGHPRVEIAWIGPVGFYARTVGASVSRVFQTLVKPAADGPRPAAARATGGS